MTETGWLPHDLASNWCEECGRAKSLRLLENLTGCSLCDDVVTRHRCTKRPELNAGESWTCPDCGTLWTAGEEEETCGECGQGVGTMHRTWVTVPGDRMDTAPRHRPQPYTPFRKNLYESARIATDRPAYSPLMGVNPAYRRPPLGDCHRTDSGIMIHVKPGCRCK